MSSPTLSAGPGVNKSVAEVLTRDRALIVDRWYHNQFVEAMPRFPNPYAETADENEVRESHLRVLIDLLSEFGRTADPLYLALYRDEKRRYSPHREGAERIRDFFAAFVDADEAAILERMSTGRDDAAKWLKAVHAPLVTASTGTEVRLLAIGDCLMGEVQSFLNPIGREVGIDLDFRYYYFSASQGADIVQDGIASAIEEGRIDMIAASYLSYQGIPLYRSLLSGADRASAEDTRALVEGIVRFIAEHLRQIRELTDVPILLHNASGLPLQRWRRLVPLTPPLSRRTQAALDQLNEAMRRLVDETENCLLVDETLVARVHGHRASDRPLLPRRIGRGANIHPSRFSRHLASHYVQLLRPLVTLKRTKLLLVDFDNTLWQGVMADGVVQQEKGRQEILKGLKEQGIILAAVSKNDPKNIRWDEMLLKEEDFAIRKINWNPKPQSIKEIAAELSLGLDSFVLVDDNPAEREVVRLELPQVVSLDSQDAECWNALSMLFRMPNTRRTEEARRRTEMYREQAARADIVRTETDYPSLMGKLGLKARIRPAIAADLDRLSELVQRTNQFNTTTIRYARTELDRLMKSDDHLVLVGHLADKFGDLGLVSVAILHREGARGTIESFVMSCRAMGFGMEQAMLAQLAAGAATGELAGRFVPSSRNEPASALYPGAGFTAAEPGLWVLPEGVRPNAPEWIAIE